MMTQLALDFDGKVRRTTYQWGRRILELAPPSAGAGKNCTQCKNFYRLDEYHRDGRASDGRESACKKCKHAYYKTSRCQARIAATKHIRKRYRDNNRARSLELDRAYRVRPSGIAAMLYASAKHRAASKGLPFTISREWVLERVLHGRCEITDLPFVAPLDKGHRINPFAATIDRERPADGYVPGNCRMVVWAYNSAKGNGTDADVKLIAERILAYHARQPNAR